MLALALLSVILVLTPTLRKKREETFVEE
jgi:hypothetical protein